MDEKAKLKVNTSKHLCGSKGTVQIVEEAVTSWDHDVSFDTLAKLSIYSMVVLETPMSIFDLFPDDHDPRNLIPGWNYSTHCQDRPGLAAGLIHHHNADPETGARNFGDIKELMEWFPAYFQDNQQECSTLFVQTDNARGGQDKTTRFAACLLFIMLDLDALGLFCQSGGHSKYNPAEKINGAIGRALSKSRIDLEVDNCFELHGTRREAIGSV